MVTSWNQVQGSSSIGEFLERTARGRRTATIANRGDTTAPGSRLAQEQVLFAKALKKALREMGLAPGRVQVTVEKTAAREAPGEMPSTRFLVSLAKPSSPQSTQAGAQTGGTPASPGPSIGRDEWTPELLTADLPSSVLAQVQDPAALLTARGERLNQPTDAQVVSAYDGNSQPINPMVLSTLDQAKQMQAKLQALGIEAGDIQEVVPRSGVFSVDYGGDNRRLYQIGPMNVGILLHRYAENVKEVADARTLAEWNAMSAA